MKVKKLAIGAFSAALVATAVAAPTASAVSVYDPITGCTYTAETWTDTGATPPAGARTYTRCDGE